MAIIKLLSLHVSCPSCQAPPRYYKVLGQAGGWKHLSCTKCGHTWLENE